MDSVLSFCLQSMAWSTQCLQVAGIEAGGIVDAAEWRDVVDIIAGSYLPAILETGLTQRLPPHVTRS
jgi:hypothetical protein